MFLYFSELLFVYISCFAWCLLLLFYVRVTFGPLKLYVSKDKSLGDKQDFDVSSEDPSGISIISSTNSRRWASARNVEILFIALVVSRSFCSFAAYYPLPTLATV